MTPPNLKDLLAADSVEAMQQLAARGPFVSPKDRPKVNSHIHLPPNFSAFETVAQAVELAAGENVGVVGVSNYYDYEVYFDFVQLARGRGIYPLLGLEVITLIDDLAAAGVKVNDPGNPGRMYICGKGATRLAPMTARAMDLLGLIRRNDTARMAAMADKLRQIFEEHGVSTGLDAGRIVQRVVARHGCPAVAVCLQERHLAQAFQEEFFALVAPPQRAAKAQQIFGCPSKAGDENGLAFQNEIRSNLMKAGKAAFVPEKFLGFDQARELILELGGIVCYPTLADGASPVCPYEDPPEELIGRLKAAGIVMAEMIPIRNQPHLLGRYVRAMRRAGIAVLGGTEHNTLEMLPLAPACVGGQPIPPDVQDIFWEGACVVAGHQFLTLHGRCGFVDAAGRPNEAYATDEQRINAFASLGAAVIARYIRSADAP